MMNPAAGTTFSFNTPLNNSSSNPLNNALATDLDFIYADRDSHPNEIAELYSYSEENDFFANKSMFEELMEDLGFPLKWAHMSDDQKKRVLMKLSEGIDLSSKRNRIRNVRAVLYLIQGNFGDCLTLDEQEKNARDNAYLFYELGLFHQFVHLLHYEIDASINAPGSIKKSTITLGDSSDLRAILSVLYTVVEVMDSEEGPDEARIEARERLREELRNPISVTGSESDGELLAITLFQMTTKFCNGTAPHFPIKKVLLLLWKVLLFTLGGSGTLKQLKSVYRQRVALSPVPDDSLEITRNMRAASPPASATDLIEAQQQRKANRPFKRSMIKQNAIISDDNLNGGSYNDSENNGDDDNQNDFNPEEKVDIGPRPASPRPSTPAPERETEEPSLHIPEVGKGLPWAPKVRQKDIDAFLDQTRMKFIGYVLPNDRSTTAGFPEPIVEGLRILEQHIYVSLGELQIKREEEMAKYPLTVKELDTLPLESSTETLYRFMFPNLPQFMIALLKILLAAAPTSKSKTESINIMCDVLPEDMPSSMLQSMKLGVDVNRHKEIIIKAVSGILLLLLKHLKINHIYQFEYLAQQLMFANCIPLVLKFFNQNILGYISAKNTISVIDFPACVIGEQPELTSETLEIGEQLPYCWRNMFSCINLLRILNKLTKWKHSRVMMLVVFKSAPILKRALKVRHAMLQLYVLKLLKMQAKYLGRQWRKSNMKTMSAIYQKVRHRITDDWAYGNDLDARPWDFQAEEFTLQANINRFHARRYEKPPNTAAPQAVLSASMNVSDSGTNSLPFMTDFSSFHPADCNPLSVLSREIELTPQFKYNYETWLEKEVFQHQIDWDQLLTLTNTANDM